MPRLGRRIRPGAQLWFGASDGSQSVSPDIIDQTGAVYTPVVSHADQSITPAIIDQTGAVFAPAIVLAPDQSITLAIITQTGATFTPAFSLEVTVALIDQTGTVFTPIVGVQLERPISDIAAGGWTDQIGGTTNLYSVVDEATADDTDYVKSPYAAGPSTLELELGDFGTVPSTQGHVLRYRYAKDPPGERLSLTVRLVQGATTIASWVHTDIEHSFLLVEQTITAAQAAAITDYNDLRVQFETLDI